MTSSNPSSRLLLRLIVDIVLLLICCAVAVVAVPKYVDTFSRGFFCQDVSLQMEFNEQILISKIHMTLLVIALPAAVVLVVEMFRGTCAKRGEIRTAINQQQYAFLGVKVPGFISECYRLIGLYVFGLSLTLIVTEFTKRKVGRLRPYFIDLCEPEFGDQQTCDEDLFGMIYVPEYKCRQPLSEEQLLSLKHSFPSDYAATSSYAMLFLVYYIQARITVDWLRLPKAILQLACVLLAMIVAFERVASERHHWSDVVAGALLGASTASFVVLAVAKLFDRVKIKRRQLKEDRIYGVFGVPTIPRTRY